MKTNMTGHARYDRTNRINYIIDTIGIGNVIAEIATVDDLGRAGFQKLTDTGVIIVLSADNKTIVTAFIGTLAQVCNVYKTAKKCQRLPDGLYNKVLNNNKYLQKQPKY